MHSIFEDGLQTQKIRIACLRETTPILQKTQSVNGMSKDEPLTLWVLW